MTNSRAKGAAGERELAKELQKLGIQARRGQQFSGSPDSPDVVTDMENVHIECKREETNKRVYDWMRQAVDDAGEKVPVVAHRKNREPWLVTLRLDDLNQLIEEFNQRRIS